MKTGVLDTGGAAGIIIWIPNEAHEPPGKARMAPVNGPFLPETAQVGVGSMVTWVSDDEAHSHVISAGAIGTTKSIGSSNFSTPIKINTPGTYNVTSKGNTDMKSKIIVSGTASGKTVVGALFVPTKDLPKYKTQLEGGGFTITSSSNFTFEADKQTHVNNTCIVYSTSQNITSASTRMAAIAKTTPYT